MEIWGFDQGIDQIGRSLLSTMGKRSRLKRVLTRLTVKRSWFLDILDASRVALEGYCNLPDRSFDLLDYQFTMCLRR